MWTSVVTQQSGGWTGIPNATVPSSVLVVAGEPIGLLMALTYNETNTVFFNPWTDVGVQSNGGWTSVATSNL